LLYAIASLPKNVSVQLRVVGDGSSKKGWMKLAAKLGIAGRIEWISWPRYEQTLPYYSWADVFAFTSLRDTSGTGLLESLAAGCPIVGLNHQGAKDIMTSECAIQVSATNLESSVSGFREGIVRMATDSEAWLRLSHGASTRAKSFVWGDRPGCVEGKYEQFISCAGEVEKRPQTSSPETSVPRVLIIAVACSPVRGSEGGVGWNRAIQSARFFDTCVVTRECDLSREILDYIKANGEIERLRFVVVPDSKMGLFLENFGISFYLSYYLWQRRAFKVAKELNIQQPFDLVHQTTYCGYREPGLCWKLPIPFVWGPFGGTQDLPWRFLTSLGFSGGLREAFRTTVNQFQLRFGRAARNAFRNSAAVIAANASVQKDCLKYFGVSPEVRLETGINRIATQPKPMLDTSRPLRILWSGGLQPRKSLHLLLHALEQIPSELKVEVRILGHGSEMSRWMKLAKKLRVDDHTQFLGWLPHHEALQLLSWADVFVFTSLRETSGNVVLEALAEGLPVIVLDHQGVRDIVTEDCGIKIPVTSPNVVAAALAKAIAGLAKAPERYQALSAGALVRAKTYAWDSHGEHMAAVYRRVMKHK